MKLGKVNQFDSFYREVAERPLPIKTSYKLMKLYNAVAENRDFYQNKLDAILNKYCEKDDKGELIIDHNGVKIKPECSVDCMKELSELDNIDIDTPNVKFALDELEGLNITLPQMNMLMEFIEE